MLPFLPLGGKGKFTVAEARIQRNDSTVQLRDRLADSIRTEVDANQDKHNGIDIEMVTPLVLQNNDMALMQQADRWYPKSLRRYRVWRTGIYPDITNSKGGRNFYKKGRKLHADDPTTGQAEHQPSDSPPSDNWHEHVVGRTSQAVPALADGSKFGFAKDKVDLLADAFIKGIGRTDWASLGWGQHFFCTPSETASGGTSNLRGEHG